MIDLIYNFSVITMATLLFFMKFTAPNPSLELFIKASGKAVPLFCIFYAGIQIFKYYGVL